jgi:hypothetical protein
MLVTVLVLICSQYVSYLPFRKHFTADEFPLILTPSSAPNNSKIAAKLTNLPGN